MSSINVPVPMIVSSDIEAEEMSIGQKLTSGISSVIDKNIYLFRASAAGSADVVVDKIIGGTVAWNQLVQNANITFTSGSTDTRALFFVFRKSASPYTTLFQKQNVQVGVLTSIVASSFDGYAEMTHSGSQRNIRITPVDGFQLVNGHKYYFKVNFTGVDTSTVGGVTAKDIQVYDITAMFGSAIADYAYTLESNTAGAGIAWLRSYDFFKKLYYANNAGQLMSVKTSAYKMVGFNQWDEEWELGGINATTGENTVGTATIRAKNKFRILPNTVYHLKCSAAVAARYYDANENYLASYAVAITANSNFTTPSEAAYMRFQVFAAYGTTYNHDICVNLSKTTGYPQNGHYKPYSERSYALDDIELRGILKLDASNNLYYDGDEYASDGTVERRYGVVTLDGAQGMPNASVFGGSANNAVARWVLGSPAKAISTTEFPPAICDKLAPCIAANGGSFAAWKDNASLVDTFTITADGGKVCIAIKETSVTGIDSLNAYLSSNPITIVYELATSTTEIADSYTNPQAVSADGTEEYVDDRDVPIPVGHETQYIERSSFVNNQNGAFKMTVSSNGVVI